MIEFFRRMFAPERSSETAKERLKLVLLSDHLSLAPDVVAALKRDLLEVISRYVEIDPAHADVTFEQRDREVAMLASIPITGMRDRVASAPVPPALVDAPVASADAIASVEPVHAEVASIDASSPPAQPPVEAPRGGSHAEPEAEAVVEPVAEPVAETVLRRGVTAPGDATASSAASPVRRRKRRRKPAATNVPRGVPAHGTPGFDPA